MIERDTDRATKGDLALVGATIGSMVAAGAVAHRVTGSRLVGLFAALLAPVGLLVTTVAYVMTRMTWDGVRREARRVTKA